LGFKEEKEFKMTETAENKPVEAAVAKPAPVKKAPIKSIMGVADYCSLNKLNKFETLVFTKVMETVHRGKRFTAEEWEAKKKEFYSRKA
jgi:hypothetical protein